MIKVGVVLCALALPVAADDYKGRAVDLDYKAAPVAQVLYTLADVGNVNVVLLDGGSTAIDLKAAHTPWDKAMVDAIALAKLAYVRAGNVYIVGPQAAIDARKGTQHTYKGATVDLDVVDASADDVLALLATATSSPMAAKPGAPKRAKLHVKHVPADQAAELVLLQTGGAAADKPAVPAKASGCAAPSTRASDVKLAAIAMAGATGAVLASDGTRFGKGDCVGSDKLSVHAIGRDFVELGDKPAVKLELHPVP